MSENISQDEKIGIILTAGSSSTATFQLFEKYEHTITEGKLVQILSAGRRILAHVSNVEPHNDFYTKGDAWSESRRKDFKIPSNVARQYVTCELEILGEIPNLRLIDRPPIPGESVCQIDVSDPKKIFGIGKDEPGYVWYGSLLGYDNAPIPLDIEDIPMHMAVFGTTGSGKSYNMGALIEKFTSIPASKNRRVAMPMIIIDSNADYVDYPSNVDKLKENGSACRKITRYVFPVSTLRGQRNTEDLRIDLGTMTRSELAEIIMQFYTGGELPELQISGLERVIEAVEEENIIGNPTADPPVFKYNELFSNNSVYQRLLDHLGTMSTGANTQIHRSVAGAILRALEKFRREALATKIFSGDPTITEDFLDHLTSNHEICIIDFSADAAPGISLELKQAIVGYFASLIYQKFTKYKTQKGKQRYIIFAMEEAHNYVPNDAVYKVGAGLAKKKLHLIATQGRKFGIGLCLISQRPAFLDDVVVSMINSFFIHRVAFDDVSFVRKVTGGLSKTRESKLTTLSRGQVIVAGQMSKRLPIPLTIRVPERDRKIPHTAGTTNVVEGLLGDQ